MTDARVKTPDWLTKQATAAKRSLPFRIGQWVKFKPVQPIADAHTLPDGFVVGIYRPGRAQGRITLNDKPLPEQFSHERIVLVAPDGNNVPFFDGQELHRALWFPPEACPQLQAVTNRSEIPAARLATAHPNWKPQP
jgi:hypothetical protein